MINNQANIGNYIEPTEKLLDFAINRLENYTENIIDTCKVAEEIPAGTVHIIKLSGITKEIDNSGYLLVYDNENFLSTLKYENYSVENDIYTFEVSGKLQHAAKIGCNCIITDATETLFKSLIKYTRTDYEGVFELYPQKQAPMALTMYGGSNTGSMPRRNAEIAILILTENKGSRQKSFYSVLTLLDKVIKALDHEQFNQVVFEKPKDRPVAFEGLGVSAVDIRFDVSDF